MFSTYVKSIVLFFVVLFSSAYSLDVKPPRITIIITVDQFGHEYFNRIGKHFTGGLKFLKVNGICYSNAYLPHAMPSTAIGHVALNTGTFANYHGIIGNSWRDGNLKKIAFDDDSAEDTVVFSPNGLYEYGKSAHNIIVDGISDQLMLQSRSNSPITVYALSYKSRSAIGNAGKLGKAIWFDTKAGKFTSSKAYFDKFPDWLKLFNKKISVDKLLKEKWQPFYNPNSIAYATADGGSTAPFKRTLSILGDKTDKLFLNNEDPYNTFIRTPAANELLLGLAKTFIDNHLKKNKEHRIILWISLSPLDKLCHFFGPHGKETLDMIYHLDYQLKRFFNFVHRRIKQSNVLYVLTADHGTEPIPEYLQNKGLKNARRILIPIVCKKIEECIQQQHSIDIKCAIKTPQIYLDKTFDNLDKKKQNAILQTVKRFMEQQEGIKKAWTYNEIVKECINKDQIEYYYKNQQFPGRSGHITFQVFPYVQMTKHPAGTAHRTPYEWNTHVPLIFYQKGIFEHKVINERVWLLQFANSLAQIHKVAKPSASTFNILPGLIPTEDISY